MESLSQYNKTLFNKNWGWFLGWGILLVTLGILAITYSAITTLVSIIFLGIILIIGGIIVLIETFQFWWDKWGGFFAHLIVGLLYLACGILLIKLPVLGSVSLTLFLSIFYISLGIFRIVYCLSVKLPHRGWRLFNGAIALILGILILAQWPASGLFIIGLFIGIDLLFSGWVYIMMALSARRLEAVS
jgi:uncharacterized membrane protein HdeD (DUF308 family)